MLTVQIFPIGIVALRIVGKVSFTIGIEIIEEVFAGTHRVKACVRCVCLCDTVETSRVPF